MKERYIVYTTHSGEKLFETDKIERAYDFVEYREKLNKHGEYSEKYEIVKVVR